jgi:hypothetical protein
VGQRKDEITQSPVQIRKAIAQARADLRAHLSALANPPISNEAHGDQTVPTPAKTKRTAAKTDPAKTKRTAAKTEKKAELKSEKPAAKTKSASKTKPKSTASKKRTPARIAKSAAVTAGHVLDTMAAGAVVGAVKAAAQAVVEKEATKGRRRSPSTTVEVLGEMAPDAAVGAIAGAAEAVMPEESEPSKPKAKRKNTKKDESPKRK